MVAIWPEELPCMPIAGTLDVDVEPNVEEFKPQVGSPQRSKTYTINRKPYKFDIEVTSEQLEMLQDDFYLSECGNGTRRFLMRDVLDHSSIPKRKLFKWDTPPRGVQVGPNRFRVPIAITREN